MAGVATVAGVAGQRNGEGSVVDTRGNGNILREAKFQPIGKKGSTSKLAKFQLIGRNDSISRLAK